VNFAKIIENAQAMPEIEGHDVIPDPLGGSSTSSSVASTIGSEPEEGEIPSAAKYNFEYHCARLVVGPVESGFINGQAVYEDHDDSEQLKEIMDMVLHGKAVLYQKKETFLRSGATVTWVEWMTPKDMSTPKEPGVLTLEEMRDQGRKGTPDPANE